MADSDEQKIQELESKLREMSEAREELRRSEERLRLMIAAVKDYAIFMLDPDGKVASWNEGAKRFKGYEAHEVIGQHFSKFYMDSDIKRGHPEFELKQAREEGKYEEEGWRVRKDGTKFWASVVITRVNDSQGKLLGFVKVTRDLTEKKQAYENLEKRVQERTKDLEIALKTRDEFLSIASHELKTPLTSLKLQLQLSRRRVEADPALSKSMDIGIKQVNSLNHLVDDLLDVSRIQTGVLTLTMEKFNVSELVEEILFRFEEHLKLAGCEVKKNLDPQLEGNWDRNRIEQILVNLVFNAIKYAPGKEITVTSRNENDHAIIEVADKGPGVEQSQIDMIFERFTRVGSPQNVGGLGLGLFITKKIVELHHGTIKVETSPGNGAKFIVCLPL